MSLKTLLSEINTGIWLVETNNPNSYQDVLTGLRNGAFTTENASMFYKVMGQSKTFSSGESKLLNKVAIISFEGELTKSSAACNIGADQLVSKIQEYNNDSSIIGMIFKMDGPGGNADVMPLFNELKTEIKKPIISVVEKACSLHYYVASVLSDKILMANDFTAVAGSIGAMVMFQKPERELVMIRPKQSSDKNEELIQALEGNYEMIEKKLEPLAQRFIDDVKQARPNIAEEVLHGKVLYAKDCVKFGLADAIGNVNKAYQLIITQHELNLKSNK